MSIADGIHTLSTRAVVEEAPQGASPTYEGVLPGLRPRGLLHGQHGTGRVGEIAFRL